MGQIKPMFDLDFILDKRIPQTKEEERRRAALKVCNLAGCVEDARTVLLALDLIDVQP